MGKKTSGKDGRHSSRLKYFFFPPPNSPRRAYILPYVVLGIFVIIFIVAGAYGWDYTNSPTFCGTTCHTMPPQNATYLVSPHSNVYCTECHIGRGFLGTQLSRKTEDLYEIYSMIFHTYEYPLQASRSRPARETCEKCHQPEAFSFDSLRTISHFQDDRDNSLLTTYLILKTGGGKKSEGLGKGIHWHVLNKVEFYSSDPLQQSIPYIRVHNDDGSVSEFIDVESDFDVSSIDDNELVTMDCITCHNRVSHDFKNPRDSIDSAMERGIISSDIPFIRKKAVEILSVDYPTTVEALDAFQSLESYYKENASDYYWDNKEEITLAISAIKDIYSQSVFLDQEVTWETHPNNLGHMNFPGCFRCHDGKHLDNKDEAIRLECNLCHSIPVVSSPREFITTIEFSHGPEPLSHLNTNWINLHHSVFDNTCTNCHTTSDPGGVSNSSFCSNSACHGVPYTFAGFDAPGLKEILFAGLPPAQPLQTLVPVIGIPTFELNIQPIFEARCAACHKPGTAPLGLDLSTYSGVLRGSSTGPVIIPGNPTDSKLVIIQSSPHFTNFTDEELELIIRWIQEGSIEK